MKKLVVDKSQCISCGMCAGLDEEHFELDENGLSEVKSQENLETPELNDALTQCPTEAIKLEDDEEK